MQSGKIRLGVSSSNKNNGKKLKWRRMRGRNKQFSGEQPRRWKVALNLMRPNKMGPTNHWGGASEAGESTDVVLTDCIKRNGCHAAIISAEWNSVYAAGGLWNARPALWRFFFSFFWNMATDSLLLAWGRRAPGTLACVFVVKVQWTTSCWWKLALLALTLIKNFNCFVLITRTH